MKAAIYQDLSVAVTKTQLNAVVMNVLDNQYKIFWGFKSGKMILNIYNYDTNNKLTFIRHKGFLELIHAKITCQTVEKTLDNCFNFISHVKSQSKKLPKMNKDLIYQEIDYYLMELHEQKQQKNVISIMEIKKKLAELQCEWQRLEESSKQQGAIQKD